MARRAPVTFLSLAIALTATLLVRPALATCILTCDVLEARSDCSEVQLTTWSVDQTLQFSATCMGCCSPPGGPVNCSPADPADFIGSFGLMEDATSQFVLGQFTATGTQCGRTVIAFDGSLASGTRYAIVLSSQIVAQFDATGSAADLSLPQDLAVAVDLASLHDLAAADAVLPSDGPVAAIDAGVVDQAVVDLAMAPPPPEETSAKKRGGCSVGGEEAPGPPLLLLIAVGTLLRRRGGLLR